MNDVVLHIGVQKTATTYVQQRFRLNRDILVQHGVRYPRLRMDYDHQALTTTWHRTRFKNSYYFPYGASGYFDRVMRRYCNRKETLFLSSECIYLIEEPEKLSDFKSRFAGFDRVRLILVVRPQTELIQSMWMEVCKMRQAPLDPARFVDLTIEKHKAIGNPIEFGAIYRRLSQTFGAKNVTVVNYHALRSCPGGAFGFFLRQLGIKAAPKEFADVERSLANVSPDPLASAVFRQTFARDTLDPAFIRRLSRVISPDAKAKTTLFSRDQFTRARAEFDPLNRAFVEEVRKTQQDFDLTIPDLPTGTIHPEDLSAETWARVARLAAERTPDRPSTVLWRTIKKNLPPALTQYAHLLPGKAKSARRGTH